MSSPERCGLRPQRGTRPAEAREARAESKQRIRGRALDLGFAAAAVASVGPLEAQDRYETWLAAGRHAGMEWLASPRHRARRTDPALVLLGIRSVVCVALPYPPDRDPERDGRAGRIARYAVGEDYHRVMKDKLIALARTAVEALPGARCLWYSDTGAILERGWAERAGLGWIGKHSGLLSQAIGSWFVLGELLLDQPLESDPPIEREHCGTCRRCLDACPTGAIVAPYQVDARLCISYLTIENRGPIPRELRPLVGDWVFGCDVCQEVCPWNRFAPQAREARLHGRRLEGWTLERFLELDEAGFSSLFAQSPIRRARRAGFLRNVCVALGNRASSSSVPALVRALADPEPLVRAHAAWALGEIGHRLETETARSTIGHALEETLRDASPAVAEEAAAARESMGRAGGLRLSPAIPNVLS